MRELQVLKDIMSRFEADPDLDNTRVLQENNQQVLERDYSTGRAPNDPRRAAGNALVGQGAPTAESMRKRQEKMDRIWARNVAMTEGTDRFGGYSPRRPPSPYKPMPKLRVNIREAFWTGRGS
jgi:hypothetical protein